MVYRPYRTHRSGGGTTTVIVEVPVGDGDIDILWADSLDIADSLAGTLGPVLAPDTFDISDEFVADELVLQESIDASDQLRPITDMVFDESIDFSAALSGTLGPIRAPDTFDISDKFVADNMRVFDSMDFSDFVPEPSLDVTALDSFTISDNLGNITQFEDDSMKLFDDPVADLRYIDSIQVGAEMGALLQQNFGDMFDLGTSSSLTSNQVRDDSFDIDDALNGPNSTVPETFVFEAVFGPQDLDATEYAETVETSSTSGNGASIEDAGDALENTPGTNAALICASTGFPLPTTSNTRNFDFIVALGDFDIDGALDTIDDVQLIWYWGYQESTLKGAAAGCNLNFQYSTDGGSNWTTAFNRNIVLGGATGTNEPEADDPFDLTSVVNDDWTKLQGLQMRVVGTITSGAGIVTASTFRVRLHSFRVEVTASQS